MFPATVADLQWPKAQVSWRMFDGISGGVFGLNTVGKTESCKRIMEKSTCESLISTIIKTKVHILSLSCSWQPGFILICLHCEIYSMSAINLNMMELIWGGAMSSSKETFYRNIILIQYVIFEGCRQQILDLLYETLTSPCMEEMCVCNCDESSLRQGNGT